MDSKEKPEVGKVVPDLEKIREVGTKGFKDWPRSYD
jgi:hypothetical protein